MGVVLLGYRGSGKTTVGRALAARAGRAFVDADERLVRRAGRSIKAIFATDGESAFRDLESGVLADLLKQPDAVLGLGGGVVLRPANRAALIASATDRIYLHADAATLHARIHADPATAAQRPVLTHLGGGLDEIRTLLAVREPLYREVMTHELDVTAMSVDDVVTHLLVFLWPQMNADERR